MPVIYMPKDTRAQDRASAFSNTFSTVFGAANQLQRTSIMKEEEERKKLAMALEMLDKTGGEISEDMINKMAKITGSDAETLKSAFSTKKSIDQTLSGAPPPITGDTFEGSIPKGSSVTESSEKPVYRWKSSAERALDQKRAEFGITKEQFPESLAMKREEKQMESDIRFGEKKKESEEIVIPQAEAMKEMELRWKQEYDKTERGKLELEKLKQEGNELGARAGMESEHGKLFGSMSRYYDEVKGLEAAARAGDKVASEKLKSFLAFDKANDSMLYEKGKNGTKDLRTYKSGSKEYTDAKTALDKAKADGIIGDYTEVTKPTWGGLGTDNKSFVVAPPKVEMSSGRTNTPSVDASGNPTGLPSTSSRKVPSGLPSTSSRKVPSVNDFPKESLKSMAPPPVGSVFSGTLSGDKKSMTLGTGEKIPVKSLGGGKYEVVIGGKRKVIKAE